MESIRKTIAVGERRYDYYSLAELGKKLGKDFSRFPYSLLVLLENLARNLDGRTVTEEDVEALASWRPEAVPARDINYYPARVVMQDFTGVPAVVDLAAMRDALIAAGGDGTKINPQIPVDLVIDHSVMVDYFGGPDAFERNVKMEFERNMERYRFLRWGQEAFRNFRVVPPGTGIIHQVNLEYLAKVVWTKESEEGAAGTAGVTAGRNGAGGSGVPVAYPDTLVGTDSHTTMINGLGVLGWGVGGIEAEAAMLGQAITMLVPEVIGFRLTGKLREGTTATDLVLTVTQMLRKRGVVDKFVEFYGPGLTGLSIADRATIANMAPEYGATCGIFPVDEETLAYLRFTGRPEETVALVEAYAKAQGMWRIEGREPVFNDTLELDLGTVEPSLAGPKRPQDRVPLSAAAASFTRDAEEVFSVKDPSRKAAVDGTGYELSHGDVVIAAITSCTNTSNPAVLMAAGLLAEKAVEKGLSVKPWVKTSLAPGSRVVTEYLLKAGLQEPLDALGFHLVGYGCTTCIGNSGPLPEPIREAIHEGDLLTVNVLSGNRNFEGRINPDSKASYLMSPPLVVAYALAGSMKTDLLTEPLGTGSDGKPVYLRDIWPSSREVTEAVTVGVKPEMFRERYSDVFTGTDEWRNIKITPSERYDWDNESTYIRLPPYFTKFSLTVPPLTDVKAARCLAILPDSTTTDHISPAGYIPPSSPAGKYLISRGVAPEEFNSYGSRRGNHEVMMRGTFANIRVKNKMVPGTEGGYTKMPDGSTGSIFDASMAWQAKGVPLVVFAGKEYGTGSSRDWAAKGTTLLGVRAVVAESYERIHRSNLIGMGVLPLEFTGGANVESLGITGDETYDIEGITKLAPRSTVTLAARKPDGAEIRVPLRVRIDTEQEFDYFRHQGILTYVLRRLAEV
jgi:aconitate hydratase